MAASQLPIKADPIERGRRAVAAAELEDGLQFVIAVNRALVDGAHALVSEALAFWHRRLKEGLATGGRLIGCGTVHEAFEVQQDHLKAAGHAYLDQGSKVSALLVQTATGGAASAKP